MLKLKTFVLISTIVWASCNNESGHVKESHQRDTVTIKEVDHERHHESITSVTLNNGQKWVANPETKSGIQSMKALVTDQNKNLTTGDCLKLKSNLETEFSNILTRCTMEGEAHEQLHNYLMPMQGLIQEMETASRDSCKKTKEHMSAYLDEFRNYFQ